jgi:hypothetical protein
MEYNGTIGFSFMSGNNLGFFFDLFENLSEWYWNATGQSTSLNHPFEMGEMFHTNPNLQMNYVYMSNSTAGFMDYEVKFYEDQREDYYVGVWGDGIGISFSPMFSDSSVDQFWGSDSIGFSYDPFGVLTDVMTFIGPSPMEENHTIAQYIDNKISYLQDTFVPLHVNMQNNNTIVIGDLVVNQYEIDYPTMDAPAETLNIVKNGISYSLNNNFTMSLD